MSQLENEMNKQPAQAQAMPQQRPPMPTKPRMASPNGLKYGMLGRARHTEIIGSLFGMACWGGLWYVGALATTELVAQFVPQVKQFPFNWIVLAACVGLSFFEIADMPNWKALFSTLKDGPSMWFLALRVYWFWLVIAGLDVGSTFAGTYIYLKEKHFTFVIQQVNLTGWLLLAVSLFVSVACAFGPEPQLRKYYRMLRGG